MKTMAIRLEDDVHAQLGLVAGLEGLTVTDIIRTAIQAYIEERKALLSDRAEAALAEIERDAAARRSAIASLFGSPGATATPEPVEEPGPAPAPPSPRGRRGGAPS